MVDTHAHLYSEKFTEDRNNMIERAIAQEVSALYLPNIDSSSIEGMLELEAQYPNNCFAMMGLHPGTVRENFRDELAIVKEWLSKRSFCAVGEIGIDLYWETNKQFIEEQKEAFLQQVDWAIELDRPIVIHSRESMDLILELLLDKKEEKLRGIFHCFTGTVEQANAAIELGFLLGIGGVLTYKKSGLDKTLASIGLEHLVLETDAPYLAPTPHRGKRNESAYIRVIAEKLAFIKEMSLEEIASITTANADRIFKY